MTTLPPPGQPRPGVDISPPNALDRWLVRRLLDAMGHPPLVFVLWNGDEIRGSESERPRVRVHLGDQRLLLEILRSSISPWERPTPTAASGSKATWYSLASFHSATSVLYQVLFSRSGEKAQGWLPWTRDDLYVDERVNAAL